MPSSAPEVNPPDEPLTIGELARRTGVAASALRYYEELGLLPAPPRVSGQRRFPGSAVTVVAAIRLQSDAGFTLAEQKALMAAGEDGPDWREVAQRKLAELDERITRAQAAREAIRHGLRCPRRDDGQRPDFRAVCPDFQARVTARRPGRPQALSRRRQGVDGIAAGRPGRWPAASR